MVQTRSAKNTTDTNIEVNWDVAEASSKNTMNQKKRKTTAENSILKPIEASKKTTKKVVNARDAGTSKKSKSSSEKSKSVVDPYEGEETLRETTNEDLALTTFMMEYKDEYLKKHPGVKRLPDEEDKAGQKKFRELVKTKKSKFVKEYFKKYQDAEAEKGRREREYREGKRKHP